MKAKRPFGAHVSLAPNSGVGQQTAGISWPNDGEDTRAIQEGHISIVHTTRYTALSPARFKDFWRD
jgi:type 1 fimbriae regulatory protein FimB/type 1 fimbriae regulatory protein FimE